MGAAKENTREIKEFVFPTFTGKTVGSGAVNPDAEVKKPKFPELEEQTFKTFDLKEKTIKQERNLESQSKGFDINPLVKEHRGLYDQADREREKEINNAVENRILQIEAEAFQKGYVDGISKGRNELVQKIKQEAEEKLVLLTSMIEEVLTTKKSLIDEQKNEVYALIRDLAKWITLRELQNDGIYIYRLLEKLLLELQAKQNILIKVSQNKFELMPEVLSTVEEVIGKLTNVRLMIDYDIESSGMSIASEHTIIRASMEDQFSQFDKLFESVGVFADDTVNKES